MKNSTFKIISALAIGFVIGGIGMKLSSTYGLGTEYHEWERQQSEISNRYFEVYGNPKTQDEQCKFDYVIYNDSTECK